MEQMARNLSFADTGFLNGCRYLLHDRDAKFCAAFTGILEAVGIQAVRLPARSPHLKRQFGKVAQIGKRGMFVENDLVRRSLTATGPIQLRSSFSR